MAVVGIEEICRVLAGDGNEPITKPRISQLVKDGMPVVGRNQYDPVRCMFWYIGKLRRSVKSRKTENEDGTSSSVEEERKRLLREQADAAAMDNAVKRGELVEIGDVEKRVTDMLVNLKARIGAVPARVAPKVVGETNRVLVQGTISKEINTALSELGEGAIFTTRKPVTKPAQGKANARARSK
jgi:phage terminase Nu1 subunit (DNA packaging protein)